MRGRGEGERKEGGGREEGDLHADANTRLILLKFPNILFFSPRSYLSHHIYVFSSVRYKKNLKKLYIVHPSRFIKVMMALFKPVIR